MGDIELVTLCFRCLELTKATVDEFAKGRHHYSECIHNCGAVNVFFK